MPLLGGKVFRIASESQSEEARDGSYVIAHTKERFESKSQYKKAMVLYLQNIWTCRATGHTNLTHQQACESEKIVMEQLESQWPKCLEKEILELVHHSTDSLEILVDKCSLKLHHQFTIGEVNLKDKFRVERIPSKDMLRHFIRVSAHRPDTSATSAWVVDEELARLHSLTNKIADFLVSPAKTFEASIQVQSKSKKRTLSDGAAGSTAKKLKLEKSNQKSKTDKCFHHGKVTAQSSTNEMDKSTHSSTASLKTTLTSRKEDDLKSCESDSDLDIPLYQFVDKTTAKSQSQKDCVDDSSDEDIPLSQITPVTAFMTPEKINGSSSTKINKSKSHKKGGKLRVNKSGSQTKSNDNKSGIQTKSNDNKSGSQTKSNDNKSGIQTKSNDNKSDIETKSNDNKSGIETKSNDNKSGIQTKSNDKKKQGKKQLIKTVETKSATKSARNGQVNSTSYPSVDPQKLPAIVVRSPAEPSPMSAIVIPSAAEPVLISGIVTQSAAKPPKISGIVTQSAAKPPKISGIVTQSAAKPPKISGIVTPSAAKPPKISAIVTPSAAKPPPIPAIAQRLLGCKRDTIYRKIKYSGLLKKAISILSQDQIKNLPEKLQKELERKKRFIEEKENMAKMTADERDTYLSEKRLRAKKIQKQKLLQKLKDKRRKFEDTDLQLSPLPEAKQVPTPDGFTGTLFGDVVMVTEFINCYSGLLMPHSDYPIYTDALMKALVGGSSGFAYLSRVLTVLLQTILQDPSTKGYRELGTLLSDVAVSAYTSSELVRLVLRCKESQDDVDTGLSEHMQLLETAEFYQLGLEHKLCLLRALCTHLLATYSVQGYMEEQQQKTNVLMRQRNTEMKQMAAQKKSVRQTVGQDKAGPHEVNTSPAPPSNHDETRAEGSQVEEPSHWGSIVKRRRVLAARAAAERDKQEKERKAMREKEYQEEKKMEKLRKKQEQAMETYNLARMVLRQDPIGTDRHHDRYWVFTCVTPGLYVERGWMGEEAEYTVECQVKAEAESGVSSGEEKSDQDKECEHVSTTPGKSVYRARRHVIETSFPKADQNLWLTYRSQKDLDNLLKALHPQGIRESLLRAEIKKRYDDISRAIIQAQRTNLELRSSDGDTEMVAAFKRELLDVELRLRNGGLGGVSDFEKWEAQLMEASSISALREFLLEVKDCILEKFLHGCLKPAPKSSQEPGTGESADGEGSKGGDKDKDDRNEKASRDWQEAVQGCQTLSRLHVLMAMLDTYVKWEKSAQNAKCKICGKKCNDAKLLLCDTCNQPFHMYCLRPALTKLPSGDWFCPACQPHKPELRPLELDSETEKEEACRQCGGKEKLIFCSKCLAAVHGQCHEPPLRHSPRGTWVCSDCKNASRRDSSSLRASAKRRYTNEVSASEEEEEQVASEDEGEQEGQPRACARKQVSVCRNTARQSRSQNSSAVSNPRSKRGPSELSLCEDILEKVMKQKCSWPFLAPVDRKLVPDYYALIKKPMDFQTMQRKCTRLSYSSPQEFIEDAALVFENAEAYNKADSDVYTCMRETEKVFKDALNKLLPDWHFYRTIVDSELSSSGSETGRRHSRNK